ncbi:MAG TPA: hypothetical protein VMA98_08540 [Candidatus Acidoferrales bacterium]|nr:hypothetical protein [Candidatus Acidoferrales bacterium]
MSVSHVPPVTHNPQTTPTPPAQPVAPPQHQQQTQNVAAAPPNPPARTPHSNATFPNGNGGKGAVVDKHR